MKDRIRELRRALHLSQEAFGKQLGVTRFSILNYENGTRPMPDSLVKLACQINNVNYDWMIKGEGKMFMDNFESTMQKLALEYDLNSFDKVMILRYLKMDKASRESLKEYLGYLAVDVMEKIAE